MDILFYTKNYTEKKRYIVGEIKNVEILSKEEMDEVYEKYCENGWLNEMKADIDKVDGNSNLIIETFQGTHDITNIRFRPNDFKRYNLIEIPERVEFNRKERFLFNDIPQEVLAILDGEVQKESKIKCPTLKE